jgi:hypothetical protein
VSLTDQELLTFPEHISPPPGFSGVRVAPSLVFCVVFCRPLLVLFFTISLSVVQFTVFNNPIIIVKRLLSRKNTISAMGFDPGTSCSINQHYIKYVK